MALLVHLVSLVQLVRMENEESAVLRDLLVCLDSLVCRENVAVMATQEKMVYLAYKVALVTKVPQVPQDSQAHQVYLDFRV